MKSEQAAASPIATTTSTTTAASVALMWGIRGVSIDILLKVFERGVCTTKELAEALNLPLNYVRTYLHRLKRYGFLKKVGFCGWTITEDCRLLNNINEAYRATLEQQKSNTRATLGNTFLPNGKSNKQYIYQLSLEPWIRERDPGEIEVVVDMLVKHLNETGEKYIYLPGTIHQPD